MKKKFLPWILPVSLLSVSLLCLCGGAHAQGIGIGTTTPDPSAVLDVASSSRGFLIPRMDLSGIFRIANPAKGLLVYDSLGNQLMVNMGTPSSPNWQNVIVNDGWIQRGNKGTDPRFHFIGTRDNADLNFRVNNVPAGQIRKDSGILGLNTSWGYHSGPGKRFNALITSVGAFAQANDSALNAAVTAIGSHALQFSQGDPTTGDGDNTAVGAFALQSMISGIQNTAVGAHAMDNASGSNNIAIGVSTFAANIDGQNNIAIGNGALSLTTHSSENTVVGAGSGTKHNMGSGNTLLGANLDIASDNLSNVIAIGQDITVNSSNTVRIGNAATVSIGGQVGWTNFSDGRFKKDIKEEVKGIDFITRLRPVTYRLDATAIQDRQGKAGKRHPSMAQSLTRREQTVFSGFSAQEVEKAAGEAGYAFSGVDKPANDQSFYGLRYADFVVPLVKAFQEQQRIIESLQKEIDAVERQLGGK